MQWQAPCPKVSLVERCLWVVLANAFVFVLYILAWCIDAACVELIIASMLLLLLVLAYSLKLCDHAQHGLCECVCGGLCGLSRVHIQAIASKNTFVVVDVRYIHWQTDRMRLLLRVFYSWVESCIERSVYRDFCTCCKCNVCNHRDCSFSQHFKSAPHHTEQDEEKSIKISTTILRMQSERLQRFHFSLDTNKIESKQKKYELNCSVQKYSDNLFWSNRSNRCICYQCMHDEHLKSIIVCTVLFFRYKQFRKNCVDRPQWLQ